MAEYVYTDEFEDDFKLNLGNRDKSNNLNNYNSGKFIDGVTRLKVGDDYRMGVGLSGFGGRGEIYGGNPNYLNFPDRYMQRLPEFNVDKVSNRVRQGYRFTHQSASAEIGGLSSRHPVNSGPDVNGIETLRTSGQILKVNTRLLQVDGNNNSSRMGIILSKYQIAREDERTNFSTTNLGGAMAWNHSCGFSFGNGEIYMWYITTGGSIQYWREIDGVWQWSGTAGNSLFETTQNRSYMFEMEVNDGVLYMKVYNDDISVNNLGELVLSASVNWNDVRFNGEHSFFNVGRFYSGTAGIRSFDIHNLYYQSDSGLSGGDARDIEQIEGMVKNVITSSSEKKPHFTTDGVSGNSIVGTFDYWKKVVISPESLGSGAGLKVIPQVSDDNVNFVNITDGEFEYPAVTEKEFTKNSETEKEYLRLKFEYTVL